MEPVDGNAIGGLLMEVFGTDMTLARGTCAGCGAISPVAEFTVYRSAMGSVARCRACDACLAVFVRIRGVTCVDLRGLAVLE